jgi:hypothetical protein
MLFSNILNQIEATTALHALSGLKKGLNIQLSELGWYNRQACADIR